MRVSAKELYGLRAMSEFARHFGQGPLSLAEVARTQGISQAYLEQIAIDLRRAGLLHSKRGAQGGYCPGTRSPERRQPAMSSVPWKVRSCPSSVWSSKSASPAPTKMAAARVASGNRCAIDWWRPWIRSRLADLQQSEMKEWKSGERVDYATLGQG